jgi:hypothetical protein
MAQQVENAFAQVPSVSKEVHRPGALREQIHEKWLVRFGRVTALARQDQIIAPIVGLLAFPRRYVVERDVSRCVRHATVGTYRPVLGK